MVHLGEISERLNKDPEEMEKFIADPVGYLKEKGLHLSDKQAEELAKAVKNPNPPRVRSERGTELAIRIVDNNASGIDWEDK